MARTQARILVSIWSDPDFLSLPPEPQRLYLFLLSQPNLNHAGLLPLTIRRWSLSATALSTADVSNSLSRLEAERFVVIDEDTEELLIRTLVRNDGIWRQSKVMQAMKADVGEIASTKIKSALREELAKIDIDALDDLKEESRVTVIAVLQELLETLPDTPSDTPTDTPSEASAKGIGYLHARAGAPSSASTTTSTNSHVPVAPKPAREPDEIWDSLLEACNVDTDQIPNSARGAYNKAVSDLRSVGATPSEIRRRAAIFRGQWRDVSLTPTALARRWSECSRPPQPSGPAPSRNAQALHVAMERAQANDDRKGIAQ